MNSTTFPYEELVPTPITLPIYYASRDSLVPGFSDVWMSLMAPVIAYWVLSLFFHALDTSGWAWLEKYRIHDSAEVSSRNRATRSDVVWAVFVQQTVQTFVGYLWMRAEGEAPPISHLDSMRALAPRVAWLINVLLGPRVGRDVLAAYGPRLVAFAYWWAVPALQFLAALLVLDTWQYFLHRGLHSNTWLYQRIHSVHHRLYVPYAFGALYNHPLEGFLLDTLGAAVAQAATFMTVRQSVLFFAFSTLKTVDDHCGYALPFDPLQRAFGNNAEYHDIHHQMAGIKSNFSQPFFIHWDNILNTRMTRADLQKRTGRAKKLAHKEL